MHKVFSKLSAALFLLALSACGGGGGDSPSNTPPTISNPPAPQFNATPESLKQDVAITDPVSDIGLDNSSSLLSVLYEYVTLARQNYGEYTSESNWSPNPENLPLGKQDCETSGTAEIQYSSEGKALTIFYSNCSAPSIGTLNGAQRTTWIDRSDDELLVREEFNNLIVDYGTSVTLVGVVDNIISRSEKSVKRIRMDLKVSDEIKGIIRATDLLFNFTVEEEDNKYYFFDILDSITGQIEYQNIGVVNVSTDTVIAQHVLSGSNEALATLELDSHKGIHDGVLFALDLNGDSLREQALYVIPDEFGSEFAHSNIVFHRPEYSLPLKVSDFNNASYFDGKNIDLGTNVYFDVARHFTDMNGKWLTYTAELVKIVDTGSPHTTLGDDVTLNELVDYQISQVEAGKFVLVSNTPFEFLKYTFNITATNETGEVSETFVNVTTPVAMNTDGDDRWDIWDDDDDNDGVQDHVDAFSKDPLETIDTDEDGIGNNADTDDDGDGSLDVDDVLPLDKYCYLADDVYEEECLYKSTWGQHIDSNNFLDNDGILYFVRTADFVVHRWDTHTKRFLEPIILTGAQYTDDSVIYRMRYSAEQHAIYVQYSNGLYNDALKRVLTRIDLNVGTEEKLFMNLSKPGANHLWYRDSGKDFVVLSATDKDYSTYALDGSLIENYIFDYEYSSTSDTYYRSIRTAPFCINGFSVNPVNGSFYKLGEGSQFDDPCGSQIMSAGIEAPVSSDRTRAIFHGVGIMDTNQNIISTPPVTVAHYSIAWNNSHGLFHYKGQELYLYDNNGVLIDQRNIGGYSVDLIGRGDHFVYIKFVDNHIEINVYEP